MFSLFDFSKIIYIPTQQNRDALRGLKHEKNACDFVWFSYSYFDFDVDD